MLLSQTPFNIRCEWGDKGVSLLAPVSDVVIIVDVLSFSTSVEIATSHLARVYPFRWNDATLAESAGSVGAQIASKNSPSPYGLSPSSLTSLPANISLAMPSPNGSELSLLTGATTTVAGCLRNCRAAAESAMRK